MNIEQLKPNAIAHGPVFPEPVKIIAVVPMGSSVKIIAAGLESGKVHQPVLSPEQIATLEVSPDSKPYDGDSKRFRLGIESMRLGLAYEYDPYFSLSIARVYPLPHQLEAVYDYFLKLPRIRFLLADDPGAGKTIMAGLLVKELKVRGLIRRVLIVTPANLSFQWQRELKDRFREDFTVVRSDLLRANYGANPWQDLDQVITSVSWISRIEDAKDSLMRSHWDLIIVDEAVIAHEEARGWKVQSVESENRGFDLISRRSHPEDPETAVEVRFIEVKGRSHIGELALTTNEFQTAERLQDDFWLNVVFNCLPAGQAGATSPELHIIRNPARLGWNPIVKIEHYHVGPQAVLAASQGKQQ